MKKKDSFDFTILGLSKKQGKVLSTLVKSPSTPLAIARETRISRPTVYATLLQLRKRGLVRKHTLQSKTRWEIAPMQHIEKAFALVKQSLQENTTGRKEANISNAQVIIHHGARAVKKRINEFLRSKLHKKVRGLQGDGNASGWTKLYTQEEINENNNIQKENGAIWEAIYPKGWIEKYAAQCGIEWLTYQAGRPRRGHVIDPRYFDHAGQTLITERSILLISLNQALIIEVKNEEIRKMLISLYEFIQDNSQQIDSNAIYQRLLDKAKERTSCKSA